MGHTLEQLRAIAPTDKRFFPWSGCPELYYRPGKRVGSWSFRGTISRPRGLSEEILMSIGKDRGPDGRPRTERWLREQARILAGQVEAGIDPRKALEPVLRPKNPTQAVWDEFMLRRKAISENYRGQQELAWKYYAKPFLAEVAIEDVDTGLIERMFDAIADRPATSNDLHATLRYFFRWAGRRYEVQPNLLNRDLLDEHPARERLTESEIVKFGTKCLEHKNDKFTPSILFLLLSGCRVSLLRHWKEEWIEGDVMLIPPGIEDLKDACFLLLTPEVKRLLPHLVRPNSRHNVGAAVRRLSRQAGVTQISSHNLRTTYISYGTDLGHHESNMLALTDHKPISRVARAYIQREATKLMPVALDVAQRLAMLIELDAFLGRLSV